jgi:hypothetical protein
MTVKKQTQHEFRQRVRRISALPVAPSGPRSAHRPIVNALAGASAALPLYAAAELSFGAGPTGWIAGLPASLRDQAPLVLAAALGASLALLSIHLLRLVARKGAAARNSAAALCGALATALALLAVTALPGVAPARYADLPLDAMRAAASQITQTIPGIDLAGL